MNPCPAQALNKLKQASLSRWKPTDVKLVSASRIYKNKKSKPIGKPGENKYWVAVLDAFIGKVPNLGNYPR